MDSKNIEDNLISTTTTTTILTVVFGLVVFFHYKVFTFWSSRGIKGPIPWPIFGTNIYYTFSNKVELDTKWKKQYGRTYGLYEGYSPLLRTTDCDVIKQVFIKQFHSWTDRNCQFIHSDTQRRSLLWSKGDIWPNQRALVSPMFSANRMRHMMRIMSECVDRFIKDTEKRLEKFENPIWNKYDLSSLTLDVIASSFFGLKLNTYKAIDAQDKEDEFVQAAYRFADFDVVRFIVWLLLPRQIAAYFKYDLFSPKSFKYFENLSQKVIDQRRSPGAVKRDDIIQALIDAKIPDKYEKVFSTLDDKEAHYNAEIKHEEMEAIQQEQIGQAKHFRAFSDIEMRGQLIFFFAAGFETTASTLSFALHELANQQEAQQILVDELKSKFQPDGSSQTKEIEYGDLLDLKYLDAFLSEVLRLYGPLIESNRRLVDPDGAQLEIDGKMIHLPKGVPVSTNSYIIHHDEEYYKNADEFDISRFLPENKIRVRTGTFMPFGLGPRHCAGMRFALLEIKLALTKILLKYSVEPSDQNVHPPKFRPNAIFLQLTEDTFRLVPRQ